VIGVLSICESICHVHEFCYYFWFYPAHLLDEICSTEPYCKSIDCSPVRDVFGWIFDYTPALYIRTEWLPWFLGACFDFLGWCWPFVSWLKLPMNCLASSS
jgi:hypothetical protein